MLRKIYTGLFICVQIIKLSQTRCIIHNYIKPGEIFYMYKSANRNCTYEAVAPQHFYLFLECSIDFKMDGDSCGADKFYISLDGNKDLKDAEIFCGTGTVERSTNSNSLVVAYESSSIESSFSCSVTTIQDCGWSQTGGKDPHDGEYPSFAGVYDIRNRLFVCGGTIISFDLVVSARHCFGDNPDVSALAVVVGISDTSKRSKYEKIYGIDSILFPPENLGEPNDIALLRTSRSIRWSAGVGPACLPILQKNNTFADKDVTLLELSLDSNNHSVAQKVQAEAISNSNCSSYYPSISATQICTIASGEDTCQMASGGPVLYVKDRQFLAGIVGSESICDGQDLGVHTRITPYLDWIQSVAGLDLNYRTFN